DDPALLAVLLLAALAARRSVAFLPPAKERAAIDGPLRELGANVLISDQTALEPDVPLAGERVAATATIDPLELLALTRPTADGPFLHLRTSGTTTGRPGWTR